MPVQFSDFEAEISAFMVHMDNFTRALANLTANGRQPTAEELAAIQMVESRVMELLEAIHNARQRLVAQLPAAERERYRFDFCKCEVCGRHFAED